MGLNRAVQAAAPDIHAKVAAEKAGLFSKYTFIDPTKVAAANLTPDQQAELARLTSETKQHALAKIATLPAIMCVCYLILIGYFQAKGGYKAQVLTGHAADDEKFTGGVTGPVEA